MKLRINRMLKYAVVDGHGLRFSVFTQGCRWKCPNCQNPQTHDENGGEEIDINDIIKQIQQTPHITGVTITGGDPLLQHEAVIELCRLIKQRTTLDIVLYTGYTYSQIIEQFFDILYYVDFIVDGPYIEAFKAPDLYFMGSSNQRYIDVNKSMERGEIIQRSDYCITKNRKIG